MLMRVLPALVLFALTACAGNSSGPGPQDMTMQGPGTGLLSKLEASPFQNEMWMGDGGEAGSFIYYPAENVRVSASCRTAAGQFVCEAMHFLRNGGPIEIPRSAIDGRTSAGVKVCMRMNHPVVSFHNASGDEDSFCRFPDGSLVSNGALEHYKLRVVE